MRLIFVLDLLNSYGYFNMQCNNVWNVSNNVNVSCSILNLQYICYKYLVCVETTKGKTQKSEHVYYFPIIITICSVSRLKLRLLLINDRYGILLHQKFRRKNYDSFKNVQISQPQLFKTIMKNVVLCRKSRIFNCTKRL